MTTTPPTPKIAGGLPELPAWMDEYKIPCDAFDGSEDVRLSDRLRAYGELCRAAPAGGDDGRLSNQDDYTVVDCPHCGTCVQFVRKEAQSLRPQDSAPAGSVEVEELAKRLEHTADYEGESGGWDETIAILRKAAALLRTLSRVAVQEGMVLVPRELPPEMVSLALSHLYGSPFWRADAKPIGTFYSGHTASESELANIAECGPDRVKAAYAAMLAAAPCGVDDAERLRAIERHCWHMFDDSEDRGTYWVIEKEGHDYIELMRLLPEECPTSPGQADTAIRAASQGQEGGANG